MKRTLFALALLVPALASAAVKLNVQAHCNGESTSESFALTEQANTHTITHPASGTTTEFVLTQETAETASFEITIKHDDKALDKAEITTEYGKEAKLACSSDKVEASISFVATQLPVAKTNTTAE